MNNLKQLVVSEDGQSLVEYGLILALVAVGLVAALTALKGQLVGLFGKVGNALNIK